MWVQGEGQGQQGVLGELRVVALCKPAQTYFNILTSTAIAICVGAAQTHLSGCSPNSLHPLKKERLRDGVCEPCLVESPVNCDSGVITAVIRQLCRHLFLKGPHHQGLIKHINACYCDFNESKIAMLCCLKQEG